MKLAVLECENCVSVIIIQIAMVTQMVVQNYSRNNDRKLDF